MHIDLMWYGFSHSSHAVAGIKVGGETFQDSQGVTEAGGLLESIAASLIAQGHLPFYSFPTQR